jgi:hypothetical protein
MYVIYCLKNESFKDFILSVGISTSMSALKQFVTNINKTFLPTPYSIFLTKNVSNQKSIEFVYSILCKFGKHIHGMFFEISTEIIQPLFDLIPGENDASVPYEVIQEKYRVIQGETEYIIPKAIDGEYVAGEYVAGEYVAGEYVAGEYVAGEYVAGEYVDMATYNISSIIHDMENHYDKLKPCKNRTSKDNNYMDDIDL